MDSVLNPMIYRRMGGSGLRLSVFSLGSWVTFHNQLGPVGVREMLAAARDAGINFFDNAEAYADGQSETLMGEAIAQLGWDRLDFVVSSKYFWGLGRGADGRARPRINGRDTLNRKYLLQAIDGSLKRLRLEYIDLVYCHRPDPETPIEETVWAMHDIISRGKALYWGTSEWSAEEIRAAWNIAERHHLHKPVVEQAQYNLFHRRRVEREYARLYTDIGLGLTTWSPLASGLLTGKYRFGVPPGSRGDQGAAAFLRDGLTDARRNAAVDALGGIAAELGCSCAQLALAWAARNPRVSSVILGASTLAQLQENLGALAVLPRLNAELAARIEAAMAPCADT